jgi:L-seryl-tRNA(Ser) seleniumtransferase
MNTKQKLFRKLPSVDEIIKGNNGIRWLKEYPRRFVLEAIRRVLDSERKKIIGDSPSEISLEKLSTAVDLELKELSTYSLQPVINATGIVIHTNLGRSILSEKIFENIKKIATNYSNLEYEISKGARGKRYTHIVRLLKNLIGAEDAMIVNNNAAAVLLALNTFAKGKETIVSRSELVEIGGSFRMPDIMSASGTILKEVGTTNRTRISDYKNAISEKTALILKVHQSNYKITGFTEEVSANEIQKLAQKNKIPFIYDIGSGCLVDLKPYGIFSEPTIQETAKLKIDIITFSGDKLLGGPQGGIIIGRKKYIEKIQKNPLARAVRIDKLSLAAFEAVLMEYFDEEKAVKNIPTLKMLLQKPETIKETAKKIEAELTKLKTAAKIEVIEDISKAGGGSLPEVKIQTYVVSVKPFYTSVNNLEKKLRENIPPVIARIKSNALLIDARTIRDLDIHALVKSISSALKN